MSRHVRNTAENTDHNVLTIFLPLLAVALTVCAGACCYMERKRKQKIKKGAAVGQEEHNISDIESIISTNSRNRSYLMPSGAAGRSYRSASRTESIRSGFGGNSSYGEPPPYSGRASRRSSIASIKALEESKFGNGRINNGFKGSQRSLGRSRSLLDLNSEFDQTPMRRTRSSANMRKFSFQDNGYASDRRSQFNDDDALSLRSGRSGYSQAQQQNRLSRRQSRSQVAPSDVDYMYDRPSSIASFSNHGARSSMRRSASQPNLRNNLAKMGTYPQGILKRNEAPSEVGSRHGTSSITGVPPSGERPSSRLRSGGARSLTRLQAYGTGQGNFDRFAAGSNAANFPNPSSAQPGAFDRMPYQGSSSAAFPPYHQNNSKAWNSQYPSQYDHYNYNDNYWDQNSAIHSQAGQSQYGYGSIIY